MPSGLSPKAEPPLKQTGWKFCFTNPPRFGWQLPWSLGKWSENGVVIRDCEEVSFTNRRLEVNPLKEWTITPWHSLCVNTGFSTVGSQLSGTPVPGVALSPMPMCTPNTHMLFTQHKALRYSSLSFFLPYTSGPTSSVENSANNSLSHRTVRRLNDRMHVKFLARCLGLQ